MKEERVHQLSLPAAALMGKKKAAVPKEEGVSKKKRESNAERRARRKRTKGQKQDTAPQLDGDFQFSTGTHEVSNELMPSISTSGSDSDKQTRQNDGKSIKKTSQTPKEGRRPLQSQENGQETKSEPPTNGVSATSNSEGAGLSNGTATPTGLAEGDDFIPFDFGDSDEDDDAIDGGQSAAGGQATVFAKVAAKLGKFVQESNDPTKRKRSETGDAKNSRKRKRETTKADPYPWLVGANYTREREPARILHHELLDFVKFVGPTDQEHRVRTFVISRIQKLVENKWPTASLHVFGSFETKLYLPTSDIDLVVLSSHDGETYERPNHLRRLANWLVKARIAENIQVITSARVPIIKFIDSVTKINVDISFNKPSGLVAAGVVKRYTETMPALRPLVVFIKHFLNMRGMNEVYLGGLGSYSIICMVISFLQRHPKVATHQILQEENLGVLVVEFFELYGKRFNYDNVGIDINGKGKYFSKVDAGWQRPGQSYLLSIQDPTDPENDIAKSSFGILKVKSTFGGGHDFLVQRLYDVNDRIKDKKRSDVGLDSILSAVVSIDEDMKSGREFIASCFESDIVQEELARMDESDGEIHEVPSFDPHNLILDQRKSARRTQYVAEDESDQDDVELIDNDGHKFVRPEGYQKPMNPGDVDDLYSKLNAAPVHPAAPTAAKSKSTKDDQVYLIESSDDDTHHTTIGTQGGVIDLDSVDEVEDSKIAQVTKNVRTRYWEAKGVDNDTIDDESSEAEA